MNNVAHLNVGAASRWAKLKPTALKKLLAMDPREHIVKGILGAGEFSVIYGEPKCGKSFLAFDLALAVARGVDRCFDKKVKQGPVVYVAAEGAGGVANRVRPCGPCAISRPSPPPSNTKPRCRSRQTMPPAAMPDDL